MIKEKLKKIKKGIYEIPKEKDMNVKVRLFLSDKIKDSLDEKAIEQIINVSKLPGIKKFALGMSDIHPGYGFPIGGVAAFDLKKGVICPGGIGYDINCGIRLLRTNLNKKNFLKKREEILKSLYNKIPAGLGAGSKFQISKNNLKKILIEGSRALIELGYGEKKDYIYTEEEGKINGANPEKLSEKSLRKGIGQLGTLGAGNHFLEIQYVDKIFNKRASKKFNIKRNQIMIMIHTGSRGLGHQVATDYMEKIKKKYKNQDEELLYIPTKDKLYNDYFSAMACAANFAFANRQLITYFIREEIKKFFPKIKIEVLYEICHNIAKIEEHLINGKMEKVLVHRKGATRSLGKGRKEIPESYRRIGQPVLIPGSMGTSSYILVGTNDAEELSFGSCPHGAGRVRSRKEMSNLVKSKEIIKNLKKENIEIKSNSEKGIIEEAPEAYKDIEEVISVVEETKLGKKVARLKPLAVIKG